MSGANDDAELKAVLAREAQRHAAYFCGACGDRITDGVPHECWAWEKKKTQEDLMAPVRRFYLLLVLLLPACAAPIQVVAPDSGIVWACPQSVPKPTWKGPGFVGPGDIVVVLRDGTHRQLADAWAIGHEDWLVLNGYRIELETAFAECRTVVDEANRLNRRAP